MSDQDEKHAAGETRSAMADISVPELLTLLRDQAIAATRREEDSARREERLTAMLDHSMQFTPARLLEPRVQRPRPERLLQPGVQRPRPASQLLALGGRRLTL